MISSCKAKRVFVPGCGLDGDAIHLAILGAEVYASDISPELVEMARDRAKRVGTNGIHFETQPAENTGYQGCFFDAALFVGVFHHIDIPSALVELHRIMQSGATLIAHEVCSHSTAQRTRESHLVDQLLYPALTRFIYGRTAYVTEDERTLTQYDLDLIRSNLTRPEWNISTCSPVGYSPRGWPGCAAWSGRR
jgi:ubiquinone/menaquinone biosynthesis C-methylase UbiE